MLVLSHHGDFILGVPFQRLEHDVVAARWEPDLWFPIRGELWEESAGEAHDTRKL